MSKYYCYEYRLCKLGIAEENGAICQVFFDMGNSPAGFLLEQTPLIKKAGKQLDEYFSGKRKVFDLPLSFKGTDFQVTVWKALQSIPYGETRSYKELAEMTGNPKACRAVGMANNRNPIVIIVPCHRVIGHNGSLTGFGGGLDLKQQLLELEKNSTVLRG